MRFKPQQLSNNLANKIMPIYLITGDDIAQVLYARDLIYKYSNYEYRKIFYLEQGFDWNEFDSCINTKSLFETKILIELHIKDRLPESGSKILQNYINRPLCGQIILIIANKLDSLQQKSAWFKAIERFGTVVSVWLISINQLPITISERMQKFNLQTTKEGLEFLAHYTCGNLLAAYQEIEKLHLLYDFGELTKEQIVSAITDNSSFGVFDLLDYALLGNRALSVRALEKLRITKIEPAIILWAITRELRSLIEISYDIQCNKTHIIQAMENNRVWISRRELFKKALSRLNYSMLQNLLQRALSIDKIIKGVDTTSLVWHELNKLIQF